MKVSYHLSINFVWKSIISSQIWGYNKKNAEIKPHKWFAEVV